MNGFVSFAEELQGLLPSIVSSEILHAKWLNTLSFLENCGARKIAACEHSTLVKEEMLKHAAEEFRHAHYLKRQMTRITNKAMEDYSLSRLLGGFASYHYLSELDLHTCRYLRESILSPKDKKEAAYLLVTYAIERRAEELYPIYDQHLREFGSKVCVRSILLEEKEHLEEMQRGLQTLPFGPIYAEEICRLEGTICQKWILAVSQEIME